METCFELSTHYFDTMINYYLFQKLKFIGKGEINHLIVILEVTYSKFKYCLHTMLIHASFVHINTS